MNAWTQKEHFYLVDVTDVRKYDNTLMRMSSRY